MGHLVFRGAIMRKFAIFAAGVMAAATVLLSTGAEANEALQKQSDAAEQVILRLLHHQTAAAVEEYYGERRQYWRQEVIDVQKIPESPHYKVIIQVETFHGAHNPPYGLETLTFYIGPLDNVQLVSFDHQAEVDQYS